MFKFEFALYISLILSIIGVLFQLRRFKKEGQFFKAGKNKPRGVTAFSIHGFILNTFFQTKLFKAGKIRWGGHFVLFLGFLYLVFVHALHGVTFSVLPGYDPTLDPYQFLRNLSGVLVIAGCVGFLIRRRFNPEIFQNSPIKKKGVFSIILILLLVCSGFLLEASKIISEDVFMEMVEEYSDLGEEAELFDLKLYWQSEFYLVFDEPLSFPPKEARASELENSNLENAKFKNGKRLNEEYCISCHSNIRSAFLSSALAKGLGTTPGKILNHYRIDKTFYIIHYLLCLLMLICLPFSRLFHLLLIPVASAMQPLTRDQLPKNGSFINGSFINWSSLYGCTNCGFCSRVCSVYPNFQITKNQKMLPHSKIESVKAMINNTSQPPSQSDWWQLKEGNAECTLCHNCTDICPSNIDLQSVWILLDKQLVTMGYIENSSFLDRFSLKEWAKTEDNAFGYVSKSEITSNLADRVEAFENCIQCTICTNVCPIVDYDSNENDLTPHQVMNLLRLGKKHLATGTRMVWTCLNCYSCQEHCPQEICVADILMELRNHGSASADMIKQSQKPTPIRPNR